MGKILITGASGLIGQWLQKTLQEKGHEPIFLGRGNGKQELKYPHFEWNLQKDYINEAFFEQKIDAVIHLAGANIADKPWTKTRKQEIIDSRIKGVALLAKHFERSGHLPKAFISAAAIGIYGNRPNEILTEESPIHYNSKEFLVQSCLQWEGSLEAIKNLGIRTAALRIGIVLSKSGGALAKMLPSYRFGVGAYFGNGKQYYSWVHIEDVCRMLLFLLENEQTSGVYNGTAPHPTTNRELAATIAKARHQKALLTPVPTFAMQMAMGEMSAIVLDSAQALPKRLQAEGFQFLFPELLPALEDILR